jgi:hypothetical protein
VPQKLRPGDLNAAFSAAKINKNTLGFASKSSRQLLLSPTLFRGQEFPAKIPSDSRFPCAGPSAKL